VTSELALVLTVAGSGQLIAVALVGACAGVYLFYRGFRLLQRKRLIQDTPASKVRSAAMGLVELNGLATGPYTMNSPVTGMPCYYYRTTAWQWQRRGKNSEWVQVADECCHVPFYLDDNTGRVLVDPQGAELDIHRDFHDEFGGQIFSSHLELPANVATFLARHGVSTDTKLKVDEYCIKPKNSLFILGTLAENHGLEVAATPIHSLTATQHSISLQLGGALGSLSLGATRGFVDLGNDYTPVRAPLAAIHHASAPPLPQEKVVAALTRAGITNPAAWAAAGLSTAVVASPTASAATGAAAAPALETFDPHPPVVLMKGSHDPSFLISWRSQRAVVGTLAWKSALLIWGGPALTLLSAYVLALNFNFF